MAPEDRLDLSGGHGLALSIFCIREYSLDIPTMVPKKPKVNRLAKLFVDFSQAHEANGNKKAVRSTKEPHRTRGKVYRRRYSATAAPIRTKVHVVGSGLDTKAVSRTGAIYPSSPSQCVPESE